MTQTADTGEKVTEPELVTLTIDGTEVSVPKGTLVIRAAELIGVQIPRFCDHPLLEPVGACRQCLVEVEGQRKPGGDGQSDHRRSADQCPQGHLGDSRRRAHRHPDPTVLRSPAARPGRRLPAMPRRGRGPAQTHGVVHHDRHAGHGGSDPADLGGRRQGAARRDGAPADQPPAGLPDVRQGRRMPPAEPGDVQRPRGIPLHRRQAHLRQADQHLAWWFGPS